MARQQSGSVYEDTIAAVKSKAPAKIRKSTLPAWVRFPLMVLLNLTLSALLYTISSQFTTGDLATVSRTLNDWGSIFWLFVAKTLELAAGWYAGLDGPDLAALTFLSHLPNMHLLVSFHGIRLTTMLSCLTVDTLAVYIPFRLLRAVLPVHSAAPPRNSIANTAIIADLPIQISTSLLAAGIYAATLYASYQTWLPRFLVWHFDDLPSVSSAHDAHFPMLVLGFIPVGVAVKAFLFTPATATKPDAVERWNERFDAAKATLGETVVYNLWGYTKKTRTLIKRTGLLATVTYFVTWLQVYVTVEGVSSEGAAGWAFVWGLASVLCGLAYVWVGNVEGVNDYEDR